MWPERAKFMGGAAVKLPSELKNSAALRVAPAASEPPVTSTRPSVSSTVAAPERAAAIVPAGTQVPVAGAARFEPLTSRPTPRSEIPSTTTR